MNIREKNALDRHITGNYGEDQFKQKPISEIVKDERTVEERNADTIRNTRNDKFQVRIVEIPETDKLYEGEIRLEMTQNGFQWQVWALNEREAEQVCQALTAYYNDFD